jgi:hypothetical protein
MAQVELLQVAGRALTDLAGRQRLRQHGQRPDRADDHRRAWVGIRACSSPQPADLGNRRKALEVHRPRGELRMRAAAGPPANP